MSLKHISEYYQMLTATNYLSLCYITVKITHMLKKTPLVQLIP